MIILLTISSQQLVVDVESLVRGIIQPPTASLRDPPPKYEDLEELPPPHYSSVVTETRENPPAETTEISKPEV